MVVFTYFRAMFPWPHSSTSWPPSASSPPTAPTWPPTAPPTSSTMQPALSWTTPPPTPTPPTVHHHPGHQHDQPHYQVAPTTYPTLTPGSTDHLFGQPSALQSSWPTLTPISTATSSPTPTTSSPQVSTISHQIFPMLPLTSRFEAPTFPTAVPTFAAHAGPSFSAPCQTIPPVPHSHAIPLHRLRYHLTLSKPILHRYRHRLQRHPDTLPSKQHQRFALKNAQRNRAVLPIHQRLLL